MAHTFHAHPSPTRSVAGGQVRNFARLLDPNLLSSTAVVHVGSGDTWPLGQTLAFATVVSIGLWAAIGGIIYYFA